MNLSDFNGNTSTATVAAVTKSMTDEQVATIKQQLMDAARHNVFPNKFDMTKPFRVSIQFDNQWHNFGSYNNIEVATCIAAIASTSYYGQSANTGAFDESVVTSHPEWATWAKANASLIQKAEEQRMN